MQDSADSELLTTDGARRSACARQRVSPVAYKSALRTTVAASAAPYGYTLTIWTSGAVLSHARGIPSSTSAVLFLIGAVGAYALVGALVFAGLSEQQAPESARAVVWGALHFFSVGLALGAASLDAHFVESARSGRWEGFSRRLCTCLPPACSWLSRRRHRGGHDARDRSEPVTCSRPVRPDR
jgi:hypothetical protein